MSKQMRDVYQGFGLMLSLMLCLFSNNAKSTSIDAYRQALQQLEQQQQSLLSLLQNHLSVDNPLSNPATQLSILSDQDLTHFKRHALSQDQLDSINFRYSQLIHNTTRSYAQFKETEIEIEPIEVSPSICEGSSFPSVYAFLIAQTLAEEVLSAAKWFCREEVGGENAAIVCLPLEEKVQIFKSLAETNKICLDAKHNARMDSLLGTIDSAEAFLSSELDQKISDISDSEQVSAASEDVSVINQTLNDYLPTNLPEIQLKLDQLLNQLSTNELKIIDLKVRSRAISQRQLINDAESQDMDLRLADSQQLIIEIIQDQQRLQSQIDAIEHSLAAFDDSTVTADHMAHALTQNWGLYVVRFQVPRIYGGELENVRELLSENINQAQIAGIDIAQALSMFSAGDTAFNQSQYQLAYSEYRQSYQSLGTIKSKTCESGACDE